MWTAATIPALFVVVAMTWDLSADQTEQRIRGEQGTQAHIEYAEDRIDDKCLSLEPKALRDCIYEEIESARDHARANQDLNAQQQMAFFTKIMAWTTAGGLALGVISIAVIYSTLTEMGRTNQIMRDEQRPWITLERDTFCDFRDNEHGCNIIWDINFRNRGKSPAHNVRFNWKVVKCHRATLQAFLIEEFAQECIENPPFFNTPLVFPDDRTDFSRNRRAYFRYCVDEIAENDVQFMILACITYKFPGMGDFIGVEAAAFTIEHKSRFGPFSAKVLEFNWSRYVR